MERSALSQPLTVLVNPDSFRMSARHRLDRVQALAAAHKLPLHMTHGPESVSRALIEAGPGPSDTIAVLGGDGTLQTVITHLARTLKPGELPRILMLGGGRTNHSAHDLGTGHRLIRVLERVINAPAPPAAEARRAVLRLAHPGLPGDDFGFLLAGGLIDHVIRDVHRYRATGRGPLRRGHLSTIWRVLQLGVLRLLGGRHYIPPAMGIRAAGLGWIDGPIRLLLASTLAHENKLFDPYAKRGEGPLRVSVVTASAHAFWRNVPRLVRGHYCAEMDLDHGYMSGRTTRLEIHGLAQFCLDGQEYAVDPACPLLITPGPIFRFLRP